MHKFKGTPRGECDRIGCSTGQVQTYFNILSKLPEVISPRDAASPKRQMKTRVSMRDAINLRQKAANPLRQSAGSSRSRRSRMRSAQSSGGKYKDKNGVGQKG